MSGSLTWKLLNISEVRDEDLTENAPD
jgi:hypothetical protein